MNFKRMSRIIWFRSEHQSAYRESFDVDQEWVNESFDLDRNLQAGSWIIWFRSELQSAYHELFDLDRERVHESQFRISQESEFLILILILIDLDWNMGVCSQIIWFRSELQSAYESFDVDRERVCESFDVDLNFKVHIVNHLI